MASWSEFTSAAPALADAIGARLAAHRHVMLATLRRDGSPRLSGIEARVWEGEMWLGMMTESMKGADLRRDPRLALHSAPIDLVLAAGDAKLNGVAVPADAETIDRFRASLAEEGTPPPEGPMDLFSVQFTDASLTRVDGEELVIDAWREGGAPNQRRRR
jgi:Pyridoxamine 5'-phosphate oxidase